MKARPNRKLFEQYTSHLTIEEYEQQSEEMFWEDLIWPYIDGGKYTTPEEIARVLPWKGAKRQEALAAIDRIFNN